MTFYVQRFWNGILSFYKDITFAKINYKRVEAGLHFFLQHCYCILIIVSTNII